MILFHIKNHEKSHTHEPDFLHLQFQENPRQKFHPAKKSDRSTFSQNFPLPTAHKPLLAAATFVSLSRIFRSSFDCYSLKSLRERRTHTFIHPRHVNPILHMVSMNLTFTHVATSTPYTDGGVYLRRMFQSFLSCLRGDLLFIKRRFRNMIFSDK